MRRGRSWIIGVAIAAAGCGRINYDPIGDDDDDEPIDAREIDGPDGGPCPVGCSASGTTWYGW